MEFIITRTSDSEAIALRHFNTAEDITNFVSKQGRIVMQENHLHNPDFIHTHYNINMSLAKRMSEAKFIIEIYDDYRE